MKKLSTFILWIIISVSVSGQSGNDKGPTRLYFGVGIGLDYGGLGLQAEFLPIKNLGLFIGGGYNLVSPAYNFGLSLKLMPDKKLTPVIMAMYGYNAAMKIRSWTGSYVLEKSYYGITAGAG